jgi:D-alanyl-lipoteichoic acid acyltransferase DltB (MBOAT superfamily)
MLFNSYEFVFGFLPIILLVFYGLGHASRRWALGWLIVASLSFYAWWRPLNVLIILPSIAVNFAVARGLELLRAREDRRRGRTLLAFGLLFNACFLGYFKYTDFFIGATNDVLGSRLPLQHVVLPLGLSFITFQKIAFLIDVHSGRVDRYTLKEYCLFVLFFPQLIAGPIVHYPEMMPQFRSASCRFNSLDACVGLTQFVLGLVKKALLADGIARWVSPLYAQAAGGHEVSLLPAWAAAVGYTLQIYFDFSGYTDMALGLGRLCGIRLPANFDSPLKAPSIIDFWLRWHMTLTRFLTAYIYNPLALALTRRRAARGLPGLTARNASPGAFAVVLASPTLVTMLVSGFWHGAGYLFVLWGLLHGVYLVINHAWRRFRGARARATSRGARVLSITITFTAVVFSMVLFRSPTMAVATNLLAGMVGFHGMAIPAVIAAHAGPLGPWLQAAHVGVDTLWSGADFLSTSAWVATLLLIVFACPNTLELLGQYEPALGYRPRLQWRQSLLWRPSLAWALAASVLAAVAIVHLGEKSEFLYWQF